MSNRQHSIIIVDDDRSIRMTLAAILEQEGYDVDTAETGAMAIVKSNDKLFDLALVDMRLPDMMGTELLNKMRVRTPKMAKVMVTGYPSMQNAIAAVNEGADGYIVKPVDAAVVLEAVKKHLQKREEAAKYSEQKVLDFIETRKKELTRQGREKVLYPMSDAEFVQTMESLKGQIGNLPTTIRAALTDILGELGAVAALSYTGDAEDGNLASFARRVQELFGIGAPKILAEIVDWITRRVKKS